MSFAQALSAFSAALQSGQLAPLIQQFQLGEEATNAAAKGGKRLNKKVEIWYVRRYDV